MVYFSFDSEINHQLQEISYFVKINSKNRGDIGGK